jgi:hypothetical protein
MKAASLSDLKKELLLLSKDEILNLCISLAKYKKENKELLSYLLFEAGDEAGFISGLKAEMDELFGQINRHNTYLAKKGLRKILRIIQKNIKFSGSKQTEAELLIYFCNKLKKSGIDVQKAKVLENIYLRQLEKIDKLIVSFHEDLQADFRDARMEINLR